MPEKEATARIKINKLLEAAGWRFFQNGNDPPNIRLEPSVTIKSIDLDALGGNFEKTGRGFVDFLLLDAKGFPLIVLEAKAEDKNPLVGKEQARKYLVDLPASDFITQITSTQRTLRESSAKLIPANSVIVSTRATIGRIAINRIPMATNQGFKNVVIEDPERAVPEYVALVLTELVPTMQAWATGGTFAEISKSKFWELQIPLPPLEVQKEIVAEIEGYQARISALKQEIGEQEQKIKSTIDRVWGEQTGEEST